MTGDPPDVEEEGHVHEGPDPKDWAAAAPGLWDALLNVEHLARAQAALNGRVPPDYRAAQQEARQFLGTAADAQRGELAELVLRAYRVRLPQPDEAGLPTEAVGGFSGDSDGPGDGDHVRPVRE